MELSLQYGFICFAQESGSGGAGTRTNDGWFGSTILKRIRLISMIPLNLPNFLLYSIDISIFISYFDHFRCLILLTTNYTVCSFLPFSSFFIKIVKRIVKKVFCFAKEPR